MNTAYTVKEDLRNYRHIYVQSSANDSNHIDQLIANELVRHGFVASAGVRTMRPDEAKLVIEYQADWNWEIRKYLIELEINVRNVDSGQLIAKGRIFHPGVTNKSPEKMVAEVIGDLLARKP